MKVRNCAWAGEPVPVGARPVWARGNTVSYRCPKSIITAQSSYFVEQFSVWKRFGGGIPWSMEAKAAEAILVLEQVWQMENQHG